MVLPCLFPCGAPSKVNEGKIQKVQKVKTFVRGRAWMVWDAWLAGHDGESRQIHMKIMYFTRETTYSNRKFDIIDSNK